MQYTISDLAQEFDITPRTLRFYEDKGLIAPARIGQKRLYAARDHARLRLIMRGKRVGFSLTEIGEMLDLYDRNDNQVGQLTTTLDQCRHKISLLTRQQRDLEATVAELTEYCQTITDLLKERNVKIARG